MYKFVYTTKTSHEYDNFPWGFYSLTAKQAIQRDLLTAPKSFYACLRKNTNSNKPKNEFIRRWKAHIYSLHLSLNSYVNF